MDLDLAPSKILGSGAFTYCRKTLENAGLGFLIKDLFDDDLDGDPFKVTTWSNYSSNVNVTTPVADIPCETSLESTSNIPSSTGKNLTTRSSDPSQMCRDLEQQLISTKRNGSGYDAFKIVNTLIEKCDGYISDSNTVSLGLDRILMEIKIEGENQSFSTPNIFAHVLKIRPETFTGIHFPDSDLIQEKNVSNLALRTKIELPPTLLDNVKNQPNATISRIILAIYGNTKLFQG
ncbi:uncharacterized protein [Heptranchias perlo]|uniref:uncharacterized protein n=1 Tax=Heptranchias perlo TaxID=212740 RepID=UPI00355ABFF4